MQLQESQVERVEQGWCSGPEGSACSSNWTPVLVQQDDRLAQAIYQKVSEMHGTYTFLYWAFWAVLVVGAIVGWWVLGYKTGRSDERQECNKRTQRKSK